MFRITIFMNSEWKTYILAVWPSKVLVLYFLDLIIVLQGLFAFDNFFVKSQNEPVHPGDILARPHICNLS